MPSQNKPKDLLKSSSKLVAGTSLKSVVPGGSLHGSPISSQINQTIDRVARIPLEIKAPFTVPLEQQNFVLQDYTPSNGSQQSSVTNQSQQDVSDNSSLSNPNSDYFYLTGLKEGQPTIVLTSEFIPIYEETTGNSGNSTLSSQGRSLQLKEEAKLLTAATAISVLSQSLPILNMVRERKSDLRFFLDSLGTSSDSTNIGKFFREFHELENKIQPAFFEYPADIRSFFEFLRFNGHDLTKVKNYSQSKLWLQTLVETKRSLLSYTPEVREFSRPSNLPEDNSSVLISKDVNLPRVYLNPYSTPMSFLTDVETYRNIGTALADLLYFAFSDADKSMYCRHSKIDDLREEDFSTHYQFTDDDLSSLYSVVNILKEIRYSLFFSDPSSNTSTHNYVKKDGMNYKYWDEIFGNIPNTITEKIQPREPNLYPFEYLSLCSLSQYYFPNSGDNFGNVPFAGEKVLTFESLPPDGKISGFKYFFENNIEKTVETGDLSTPYTGYADILSAYLNGYKFSIENALRIAGLDVANSTYALKEYPEPHRSVKLVDELCADLKSPGWFYLKYSEFFGKEEFSNLGMDLRFQSTLCKLALNPDDRTKTLKTNLFMWLMSQILDEENGAVSLRSTIDFYEGKIVDNIFSTAQSYNSNKIENARRSGGLILSRQYDTSDPRNQFSWSIWSMLRNQSFFFPAMKRLLKDVYKDSAIYRQKGTETVTAYSGMNRGTFLYAYFDMLLRIISSQTPETFKCFFEADTNDSMLNPTTSKTLGIVISPPINDQFGSYFLPYNSGPFKPYMRKISYIVDKTEKDERRKVQYLLFLNTFVEKVYYQTSVLPIHLSDSRFTSFLQTFDSIFVKDIDSVWVKSDTNRVKNSLMKLSLHKNQLKLFDYAYGEMRDRLNQDETSTNNFKSIDPTLQGLLPQQVLTDLLPIDLIGMASFRLFSSYFFNSDFRPIKGNNKRIMSVGIPDGLLDKLQSSSSKGNKILSGHVKVKIWKIDRLYPDVLFKPQEYIFDTNRFPTRSLTHWNITSQSSQSGIQISSIPTKYYSPNKNTFYIQRNLSDAVNLVGLEPADQDNFRSFIPSDQERSSLITSVYNNHSISFLCEEYLKWYTDVSFNESDFYNYSKVANTDLSTTYQNVVDALRKGSSVQFGNTSSAEFVDPISGDVVSVPIQRPLQTSNSIPLTAAQNPVQLSDTTVSYLKSQSYMTDTLRHKKKIIYPKKFDRVFHIVVDPDDFSIEQSILKPERIEELVRGPFARTPSGVIVREDTKPGEVAFQEFFVSIEPYVYTS